MHLTSFAVNNHGDTKTIEPSDHADWSISVYQFIILINYINITDHFTSYT